jgi:hypothetical protein
MPETALLFELTADVKVPMRLDAPIEEVAPPPTLPVPPILIPPPEFELPVVILLVLLLLFSIWVNISLVYFSLFVISALLDSKA